MIRFFFGEGDRKKHFASDKISDEIGEEHERGVDVLKQNTIRVKLLTVNKWK